MTTTHQRTNTGQRADTNRQNGDGQRIGAALAAAVAAMQRWSTRADTRRRLDDDELEPLSATERWLLAKIADGPVRLSTLADWQRVDRSTVTIQVRTLEEAGFLIRSPDPTDGRATLVSLSKEGRRRYDEVRANASQIFNDLIADWPIKEQRQFAHLLTKFVRSLDADSP